MNVVIVRTPVISKTDMELSITNPLSLKLPFTEKLAGDVCVGGGQRVPGIGL